MFNDQYSMISIRMILFISSLRPLHLCVGQKTKQDAQSCLLEGNIQ